MSRSRVCKRIRETRETKVEVELNIDESGNVYVATPVKFLNHLLITMLSYMNSTAMVNAIDKIPFDEHHVVEDCAITLGEAFSECLGDRGGIKRFADILIPMDDALVIVSIDISGRGRAYIDLNISRGAVGDLAVENILHFLESFAYNAGITMHIIQLRGFNSHHIAEAVFKGLGITLYEASRIVYSGIRSTKGVL